MAWQILRNGAMYERVIGTREGVEVTETKIGREGDIVEGEISSAMRKLYEDGDANTRSNIAYVQQDGEDGPTSEAELPKSSPADDAEANERAEAAEKEAAELRTRVSELESEVEQAQEKLEEAQAAASEADAELTKAREEASAQIEELQGKVTEAEGSAANALTFNDFDKDALLVEAEKKGVEVTGTGANGNVKKEDVVKALEGARQAS